MPDEKDIIRQCQQGDSNAFSEIVKSYQDRLYNTVFHLVDNAEDALDICQDIFVKAYGNINSFRGDATFLTYLYRIAFNECVNFRYKRQRINTDVPELKNKVQVSGEEEIDLQDRNEHISKALSSLEPSILREVVVLKDIEGMSYAEVAKTLNISVSQVRTDLDKARQILKHKLRNLLDK